jgi:hypothetical protein
LTDAKGHEVFANAFTYLVSKGDAADAVFDDILRTLFNAPATAKLHVELLKGSEGAGISGTDGTFVAILCRL